MDLDLTGQPFHTHCAFCTDLSAWCDCVDDDVYICVSPGVKNTQYIKIFHKSTDLQIVHQENIKAELLMMEDFSATAYG